MNDTDVSQRLVSDLMIFRRKTPFDNVETFDQMEHSDNLHLKNKIKALEIKLLDIQKGILNH